MRTLVLQHTEEEQPGTLLEWLESRGLPHKVHHVYRDEQIPTGFDWLVILGGPMNVDEEHKHPWLKSEKRYLRHWLDEKKPVLGICLGGQLLAQALGARVVKNDRREIGFHPVHRTASSHPAFSRWPETLHVFQWHEDKFELPAGCQALLTNEVAPYQAFALDHRTVGLQFHPESTPEWIRDNFKGLVIRPGETHVQDRAECEALLPLHLEPMKRQFFQFLDDFLEHARR